MAKQRRVIAVEVPGVSQGQVVEAGPAAVLDGLPGVIRIALGAETAYDILSHSGGGWWTSVVLRAVRRGALHAPRRVLIMQSPVVVPAFLRIILQGQGDSRDSLPCPYRFDGSLKGWLSRVLGWYVHLLFAKCVWNLHCCYLGFTADELVILPETVVPYPETSILFLYGDNDGYTVSEECVAYIRDMLKAPHIHAANMPSAGHGTFMLRQSDWDATVSVIDSFFQRGSVP